MTKILRKDQHWRITTKSTDEFNTTAKVVPMGAFEE
jgi:hypothetical protein